MAQGKAGQQAKTAAANAKAAVENGAGAIDAAAEEAADTVSHVDLKKVSGGFGNVGQGFMGVAVALYAGVFAYAKFRQARDTKYVSE